MDRRAGASTAEPGDLAAPKPDDLASIDGKDLEFGGEVGDVIKCSVGNGRVVGQVELGQARAGGDDGADGVVVAGATIEDDVFQQRAVGG